MVKVGGLKLILSLSATNCSFLTVTAELNGFSIVISLLHYSLTIDVNSKVPIASGGVTTNPCYIKTFYISLKFTKIIQLYRKCIQKY